MKIGKKTWRSLGKQFIRAAWTVGGLGTLVSAKHPDIKIGIGIFAGWAALQGVGHYFLALSEHLDEQEKRQKPPKATKRNRRTGKSRGDASNGHDK